MMLFLDLPDLGHAFPFFEVPLAGRATAAGRLSLWPETKTAENADQLVGGHPRIRPDNIKLTLPD